MHHRYMSPHPGQAGDLSLLDDLDIPGNICMV